MSRVRAVETSFPPSLAPARPAIESTYDSKAFFGMEASAARVNSSTAPPLPNDEPLMISLSSLPGVVFLYLVAWNEATGIT